MTLMKGTLSHYKSRDEVMQRFPGAEFMPWDEPVIGTRVKKPRGAENEVGTVVGREDKEEVPEKDHKCPKCRCMKRNPFYGWWVIHWDGWYKDAGKIGGFIKLDTPPEGAEPMLGLEFPPTLVRER